MIQPEKVHKWHSEINFDKSMWTIPAEKSENGEPADLAACCLLLKGKV